MASLPRAASPPRDGEDGAAGRDREALALVDPFLVEALENPATASPDERAVNKHWQLYHNRVEGRKNITLVDISCQVLVEFLRMELDIQKFLQNHEQHQFEFQHFPSSYLRRAAHRVAQHYGLQTMVLDNLLDGIGRIAVRKTPDSRFPAVCLSDIPAKQPENKKPEQVKFVIRTRPNRTSLNGAMESGIKQSTLRTVEEREEEYDKARARIFSYSNNPEVGVPSDGITDGGNICSSRQETEGYRINVEPEKSGMKDCFSRVAIFKDREKDLNDPDYDRSYDRYSRGLSSNQSFNAGLYNVFQPFCLRYDPGFSQLRQLPQTQASVDCKSPHTVMNYYYAAASNQTSRDSIHTQWPSSAMMYAHSYEHFRNAALQAPFYQQPLSFEHYQNH